MKEVFYKKKGRRYIPVYEYDSEFTNSLPYGTHLIVVQPGVTSYTYKIDPAFAPLIAAGKYASDEMAKKIVEASEAKPQHEPLTKEQQTAWNELKKLYGNSMFYLSFPSAYDVAISGLQAMQEEANKMLSNPAVKKAWDRFMLIWQLAKEEEK